MRILIIGPFGSPQRDEAIARGFEQCGAVVRQCGYGDILYSERLATRIQFRLACGPVLHRLTERVISAARGVEPDVLFFRRPLEFTPGMLQELRRFTGQALFASFNNDDPFSPAYRDRRWRMLRKAIPLFDIHFAFRRRNMAQYRAAGAADVALWEPFYSPWLHRPIADESETAGDRFTVLFAMHAENDERRNAVHRLIKEGFDVRVHCWNWAREFGKADARAVDARPGIWGDEYARAIGEADVTLCFFSKQNGDELTSRVFEVPACGGLLAAERNDRTSELFKDDEEILLFSDVSELLDKLNHLRANRAEVLRMRRAARQRLIASKHSIVDRCGYAMSVMRNLARYRTNVVAGSIVRSEATWIGNVRE